MAKQGQDEGKKRRKRGQNEGSIYQRKDGRWCATINLGYQNGKPKRKSYYGQTQAEVQRKLTKAKHDHDQGLPIPGERQTTEQFLKQWLETSVKPSTKPRTYIVYSIAVNRHFIPAFGKVALSKLSPQHIQAMMSNCLEAKLSPRTVAHLLCILRIALSRATKWGLVARNVASLVDTPRYQRREIKPLMPEEVQILLKAIKGHTYEAIYVTALACGLRRSEILGLTWDAVDFGARLLHIRKQLLRVNGKLHLEDLKTERSRRTLSLPEIVVTTLQAHRKKQLEARMLKGDEWKENGLVFTTSLGTPLDAAYVLICFKKALEDAELPKQRLHDLRHAHASLLLMEGEDMRTIMEVLGHSNISTTADIYAHVMPVVKKQAAEKINAILMGKK